MSDITWIVLIIVLWRIVVQPVVTGYRSAGIQKRTAKETLEYTDYEEIS